MPVPLPSLFAMLVSGLAIFYLSVALWPSGEEQEAQARLGLKGVEAEEKSPIVAIMMPLYTLLIPSVAWIKAPKYRANLDRKFITAGMTGMMSSTEFLAYKLLMCILFGLLFIAVLFRGLVGWQEPIWMSAAVLLFGLQFPDIWLNGEVKRRQGLIRRSLPYVMDLLTLSVEAGLDFVQGVGKVCEKARRSPLIEELSFFLGEIQLGSSRQQSLRNLSWRADMQEIRSFSALLIQADILGASVGPVLRAQSDLIRTRRFQSAEIEGAYAAQKILFPLIICIMPAVFVVIFGPIILNFIYGNSVIGL
jgi:tight adherence protein C